MGERIFCCFWPYVQRSRVAFPNGLGIGKFNSDRLMHSLLEPKQTGAWETISIQQIRFKHNTLNNRSKKLSMRGNSFHCTVRKFSISFANHHLQSVRCRTIVCAKECSIINPFDPGAERVFIAIGFTNQITKMICSNKHLKFIMTPIARISNRSNIKKFLL